MSTTRGALQRVDWRFLLPTARVGRSVSFAGNGLMRGLVLISDQASTPNATAQGSCELAVAIDPDAATLRAAAAALAPDGWCYTEWYSPLAGGASAIRRRLARAGLADVACYWPWPPPARARTRLWVPLEAPGALRYFLTTRPPPRQPLLRVARAVAREAWGLAARQGLVFPVCAIARKPGQGSQPPGCTLPAGLAPALRGRPLELVRRRWSSWGFGPTPERLSWLLLTIGVRLENKVVGLVFAEPDPRPRLVVKLGRVAEVDERLRREARTLAALAELEPGGVPGVPRLLFCEPGAEGLTLGQSSLAGERIFTWLRPHNARELALLAADWSARLVRRGSASPPTEWWPRLVEPILAEFERLYGSVTDPAALAECVRRLRTLGPLPSAIEHRDFGWWNMLLAPRRSLAVLDWETAEIRGLPGLDLFYFTYFLSALLDGSDRYHGYRETLHRSLDPTTPTGRIQAECIDRYWRAAGLDPAAVHPLRLLTWMLQAGSDYRDIADRCGGTPGPDDLRNGLYFALWEQELRYAHPR
ncbi:MAG: aminoglycoside phosphotransferase family protein [Chloroflexota bacterium]|nr:aminoglycoside phosphotransferase family protein [Chloroflexota bacterium]